VINRLHVMTFMVVLVLAALAQAQTFTTLYNFTGGSDGGYPYAPVLRDKAGNLYSTTYEGGASGYGTVFKLDTADKETVLYSFKGGSDGANPVAGLTADPSGNLYGTTEGGGSSGVGTVFRLSKSGKEKVLYSFTGGTDGCYPTGGLLRDTAGNFYGTASECGGEGKFGSVFKLSKNGQFTVLHSFAGGEKDGAYPMFTTVLLDKVGNIYGVTEEGGSASSGVVYKLSKTGKITVLYAFAGGTDGCDVFGIPVMDKQGNLYGTANACGPYHVGMVWKVSQKGKETVLHNFAGGSSDGAEPVAGVIMDAKGNLYGDTYQGGSYNLGTVYKLDKQGTLTLLHTFNGADGSYLYAGLLRDAAGNLYSTTLYGGSGHGCNNGCGTVWQITK
jgi:uncharacterized repeat protein (TIGR03803 family)